MYFQNFIAFCYYFTLITAQNLSIFELNINNLTFIQEEKLIVNLNTNCTTHDDCNGKNSICDTTSNTCECDITTMQLRFKCKTINCQSNEECMSSFPHSSCTFGRCQCIIGKKINGKCVESIVSVNPLPDWAIVLIALSIALSAVFGGSLKKKEVRRKILAILRIIMIFGRHDNEQNNCANNESKNDGNDNEL